MRTGSPCPIRLCWRTWRNELRPTTLKKPLFAATLLASWGELKPENLKRALASGLEAGISALALSDSLERTQREALLREVVTQSNDISLSMEALRRALPLRCAWLSQAGHELWQSPTATRRALGAVALAEADEVLPTEAILALVDQLADARGALAAHHRHLAAWLLLHAPSLSDETVVQRGFRQASAPVKKAFVTAIGEFQAQRFYPLLEEAVLDPATNQEALRILAQVGQAVRLGIQWMKEGSNPISVGALLVSSAHGHEDPTPLFEAALASGRLWYLSLALVAAERSHSPLPSPELCAAIEERLKVASLVLALTSLKVHRPEEKQQWEAEAAHVQEACFSWFERTTPEWHERLSEIEYTLPKADKRARNAAMELLEEFCRGGREWFVAALDRRADVIFAALPAEMRQPGFFPFYSLVATCHDSLLTAVANYMHCADAAPMDTRQRYDRALLDAEASMPVLDPALLQKALALRASGFFKDLATEVVLDIASRAEEVTLDPKQVLFSEGDPPDGLYFVLAGELDVWMHGKVLNHLSKGSVLGEIALLDKGPRTAKLVASGQALLLKISAPLFEEIMETYPGVARGVIGTLVEYIRRQSGPSDPLHAPSMSLYQMSES